MAATNYKGFRDVHVPPGRNPNRLDMIHDPNTRIDSATPR
jgi:hypothetical protein